MSEKPILFSAPMVRAILEGRKTQTRRIIKRNLRPTDWDKNDKNYQPAFEDQYGDYHEVRKFCPFGQVGDRLYVRETWMASGFSEGNQDVTYRADNTTITYNRPEDTLIAQKKWVPSIHMPRWASRIKLEITNIRVERLQDISEEDARAEGFSSRAEFQQTWQALYGVDSWNSNPWVWVIEFKRIGE